MESLIALLNHLNNIVMAKRIKKYTIEEMRNLLEEFQQQHEYNGVVDEYYGDMAEISTMGAREFIDWLENKVD